MKMTDAAARRASMSREQDERIAEVVRQQEGRLRRFIGRRVPDPRDAEDILQDVFYELVEANRLLMPINHITGWLFQVARNRITDLFRRRAPERSTDDGGPEEDGGRLLVDLLPSADGGPEAAYRRRVLIDRLAQAVAELPPEQRDVFVAHEIDGRSFREIAQATGLNLNTLLSRKRYAVLHLRERLRTTYDEFRHT
jgi:RNA polymerase sigma factor (sigma-70 family)